MMVWADANCLPLSDLTVELCFFTGFTDSRAQQSGELKTSEGGWAGERCVGGEASYHLMLPFLHNPALSNTAKVLMRLRSRTIEPEREKEVVCPRSSLVCQCKVLTRQAFPSLPFPRPVCFPGSRLHQHSNERPWCAETSLQSLKKHSAIVSFWLICNFCCAPVQENKKIHTRLCSS